MLYYQLPPQILVLLYKYRDTCTPQVRNLFTDKPLNKIKCTRLLVLLKFFNLIKKKRNFKEGDLICHENNAKAGMPLLFQATDYDEKWYSGRNGFYYIIEGNCTKLTQVYEKPTKTLDNLFKPKPSE